MIQKIAKALVSLWKYEVEMETWSWFQKISIYLLILKERNKYFKSVADVMSSDLRANNDYGDFVKKNKKFCPFERR